MNKSNTVPATERKNKIPKIVPSAVDSSSDIGSVNTTNDKKIFDFKNVKKNTPETS